MDHTLAVTEFIRTYGSPLTRERQSGPEEVFAVISPVKNLGASAGTLEYTKAGFLPRQEYLLLMPISEEGIKKGEILTGKEKSFRVQEAEQYSLGGQAVYQRLYAYEVRSVEK